MSSLFHITTAIDWERAQTLGIYRVPSLETEGFIHLSNRDQVIGTANRFFQGQSGLVLLEIDRDRLQHPLKFETVLDHGTFPHLYGPLNLDAVIEVHSFVSDAQGDFKSFGQQ